VAASRSAAAPASARSTRRCLGGARRARFVHARAPQAYCADALERAQRTTTSTGAGFGERASLVVPDPDPGDGAHMEIDAL